MTSRDDQPHTPVLAGGQVAELRLEGRAKDKAHRRSHSAPIKLTVLTSAPLSLRRGSQGWGGEFRNHRRSQTTQTPHAQHHRAASLSIPTQTVSPRKRGELTGSGGGADKVEIFSRSGDMAPGYQAEDERPPFKQRTQAAPITPARDALVPFNEATFDDTRQGSSNLSGRFRDGRDRAATLPQSTGEMSWSRVCQWDPQAKGQDREASGAKRVDDVACGVNTPSEKPPLPELNEHGSSDSTVGIGGSPQFFLEGVKTDDEDGGLMSRDGILRIDLCALPTAVCGNSMGVTRDSHDRTGSNYDEAVDGGGNPTRETVQGGNRDGDGVGAGEGRRDSLLDTYREPEGHDWGELEDWQGLPGVGQSASADTDAGTVSTLQAPALIFRPGRVVEGDVLSLLGRPRSRQLEEAGVDPDQSDTIATLNARDTVPLNEVHGPSSVEEESRKGCRVGEAFGRGADVGEVLARGGSAQPLLLSLADLTSAGLEKMLQAEGDSKMYFDPDAQRWVGEEVDLSGFEDPPSGHGSSPRFSLGSTPAAAAAAAAAVGPSPIQPRIAESPCRQVSATVHRRWNSSGDAFNNGHGSRFRVRGSHPNRTPPPPPPPSSSSREGRVFHQRRHSSMGIITAPSESGSSARRSRSKIRSRSGSCGSSCASASLRSDSDTGSVVRLPRSSIPEGDCERLELRGIILRSGTASCAGGGTARLFFGREGNDPGAGDDNMGEMEAGVSATEAGLVRAARGATAWRIRGVSPLSALPGGGGGGGGNYTREAFESEMGASEASDWDQDSDFEDIAEDHAFELTFEQPAKFGYSPAFTTEIGFAAGVRHGDDEERAASLLPPGSMNRPSMSPPRLLRRLTIPVHSRNSSGPGKAGQSGGWGGEGSEDGRCSRANQRSYADRRCDSLGSAAEWDQTLEGDLDLALAHRPRDSSGVGQLPKPQTPSNQNSNRMSGPAGDDEKRVENADAGKSSPKESPNGNNSDERSAIGRIGRALDSLQATVKVAAAALAVVENWRNRGRKLMQEKGSASGKRLSGPVQITLEDLQAPHSPIRSSNEDGGNRSGEVKIPSPGRAVVASGAYFNKDKMRWEGFEEPDLDGFKTSDSESEPELEPCGPCAPPDRGSRSSSLEGREDGRVADCLFSSHGLSSPSPRAGTANRGDGQFGEREEMSAGLLLDKSSSRLDAGQQERMASAAAAAGGGSEGTGACIQGPCDDSRVEEFVKTWNGSLCGDENVDVPGSPTVVEEENPDESDSRKEREQDVRDRGEEGKPLREKTREEAGYGHKFYIKEALTLRSEGDTEVGASSDKRMDSVKIVDVVEGDVMKSSESGDSEVSDWDKSLGGSPVLGFVRDLKLKVLGGKGECVVCRVSPAVVSSSPLSRSGGSCSRRLEGGVLPCEKGRVAGGVGEGTERGGGGSSGGPTLITPSSRWGHDKEGRGCIGLHPRSGVMTGLVSPVGRDWNDLTDFDGGPRAGVMVTRKISDVRAVEDEALDDYGADFLDTIVLTPKLGGPRSSWSLRQMTFEEEDEMGSDGSNEATWAMSPPRGDIHSNTPGNPLMLQQGIFDESSPHHENSSSFTNSEGFEDETSWSAPEMSAESPVGGTGNRGDWEVDEEGSARGRWKNYGPAIRRVSMGGVFGGVFVGYRDKRVDTGEISSAEEESVGFEGDAKAEADRCYLSRGCTKRRGRRSRGYQIITKAEYTPIYVPNAWLNPKTSPGWKTGRWEPVDGFEVDMSGFGGDESDGSTGSPSSAFGRRKASPPPLSLISEGGESPPWSASMQSPPLGRGHSGASSTGTTTGGDTPVSREKRRKRRTRANEDRAAAFQLSIETKQHLSKSEEAHDRAMALLLGEQGYANLKQKSSARLNRLPGISDPRDEKGKEDAGEDDSQLSTLALPEPARGISASFPRPRTRSVGPGTFVGWSRSISESCSSIESGSGSPTISSSVDVQEMENDVVPVTSRGDGNGGLMTPSHSRHPSSTNSVRVTVDSPMKSSQSLPGGGSGNVGDACVIGTSSRNRREKLDTRVCSAGETGSSRARVASGGSVSAGGSVAVPSRSRRLSATSSREVLNESSMGGDSRSSPRRAWLPGVGNSSNKAAVLPASKSSSCSELNACASSVDHPVRGQSPSSSRHSSSRQWKAGKVGGGMRDSSRLRVANSRKDKWQQSGSTGSIAVQANTGGSTGGMGRRRPPSYARGSPESAPPIRRRGSRKGLVGRNAVPTRTALSPWRSPHVLRSPPRRGLMESRVRGSVGGGFRSRRATLYSSPISPLSLKALHRTSSTSVLPARLVSGETEVLSGRDAAAVILLEERERVNRRLARFGDTADFAADTIKERFSLLGARNFPESAQRRTHRRRRSGGESSAGSGSSAGLTAAIGGLTVWR